MEKLVVCTKQAQNDCGGGSSERLNCGFGLVAAYMVKDELEKEKLEESQN